MKKIKKQYNKKYVQVTIIMIVVFIVLVFALVFNVRTHYIELKNDEAVAVAKAYANTFERAVVANEIADELLNDLVIVSLSVLKERDQQMGVDDFQFDNESLASMSEILELDEIYLYNRDLEIIASASSNYIGWKSYPNHPVTIFANSQEDMFVEEIRKDSESNVYYKYGYIRLDNQQIIQTGIGADRIYDFLSDINIETIISETSNEDSIKDIYYITMDNRIVSSLNKSIIVPLSQELFNKVLSNDVTTQIINDGNESLVEVFVPILSSNQEFEGIIATRYSLSQTTGLIWSTFLTIGVPLAVILFALYRLMIARIKNNDRLMELAYMDPVTNLYNRTYLKEQVFNNEIKGHKDNQSLILINCTNFKYINQTYGFHIGDFVLKEIGSRLKKIVDFNYVFRFTADRFVVYTKNDETTQDVIRHIDAINRVFSEPYSVKSAEIMLTIQMSIIEMNQEYLSFDELMKDANYALEQQKESSLQNYVFFNHEMRQQINRNETILNELRQALMNNDHDKLTCHFQPIISIKENRIVGFESLSRLNTQTLQDVAPFEFIPIAENNQLIIALGQHILEHACQFLIQLSSAGHESMKVTVNVSAIELFQKDYVKNVLKKLKEHNIDSSLLTIEITESILFSDFDFVNRKLRQLQAYGIRAALDDFGTGYSSFDRLDGLNINILKIDKYFVDKISKRRNDEVIVSDIVSMAHKFGLTVVAEGVDNIEQLHYLQRHNCDMMQGFLFSKPLSINDALILIRNWEKVQLSKSSSI